VIDALRRGAAVVADVKCSRLLFDGIEALGVLLAAPLALVADLLHWGPVALFFLSGLAIMPLARYIGLGTEELAGRLGSAVGGTVILEDGYAAVSNHGKEWLVDPDYAPPFSFEYLQNTARYFAQQAAQIEERYIQFKSQAENEQLRRDQLNQQAEVARQSVVLEQRGVAEAQRGIDVAAADRAQMIGVDF